MRSWSIEIWLLDDQGNEVLPTVYEKAVYNLHPSFDKNKQSACPRLVSEERMLTGEQLSRNPLSALRNKVGESST